MSILNINSVTGRFLIILSLMITCFGMISGFLYSFANFGFLFGGVGMFIVVYYNYSKPRDQIPEIIQYAGFLCFGIYLTWSGLASIKDHLSIYHFILAIGIGIIAGSMIMAVWSLIKSKSKVKYTEKLTGQDGR